MAEYKIVTRIVIGGEKNLLRINVNLDPIGGPSAVHPDDLRHAAADQIAEALNDPESFGLLSVHCEGEWLQFKEGE